MLLGVFLHGWTSLMSVLPAFCGRHSPPHADESWYLISHVWLAGLYSILFCLVASPILTAEYTIFGARLFISPPALWGLEMAFIHIHHWAWPSLLQHRKNNSLLGMVSLKRVGGRVGWFTHQLYLPLIWILLVRTEDLSFHSRRGGEFQSLHPVFDSLKSMKGEKKWFAQKKKTKKLAYFLLSLCWKRILKDHLSELVYSKYTRTITRLLGELCK